MTRIWAVGLLAALAVSACGGGDGSAGVPASSPQAPECVDRDDDGHGEHCAAGRDCDDSDPSVSAECLRCAQPDTGCACELGAQAVSCFLDKTEADDGQVMCHEGSRYCRNNVWSACEDIHSYPFPDRSNSTALINPDAGAVQCNDCSVACFRITDNLDPVDNGLGNGNSNGVDWVPGGGLTLGQLPQDAGMDPDDPPYDPSMCMPGTAPDIDCDGIPDQYDPFPSDPPFATANPGIFLGIGPGETGTGVIDLDFFINSADVYFLVDQSASMTEERDNLKADLVAGDFINDANYDCADVNLNHIADDNALKSRGIIGAINCIIRDANFGVGFHREIPFSNYADNKQIAFDNYQDITSDVDDVASAVGRLDTIGNIDWPEASMLALHNIVTGSGMYFGTTKRGVPPRIDCPASTWGYPCFRDSAIPVVILFTDAMFHNGPDSNNYAYTSSNLGLTRGTAAQYYPVPVTNEGFTTSYNAGDLTNTTKTFTGDSTAMTSAIDRSTLSCLTQNGGADAFFRFDLTQTRTVRISSEGTRFDTVVGLYTGSPQSPVVLPASNNMNETGPTAASLGTINGGSVKISGTTNLMAANYDWAAVQCNANTASPDAIYSFNLSSATTVDISTVGSAFDTVVGLYSGQPALPPTYTASTNTNETLLLADVMGDAYNTVIGRSGSTVGRVANYSGAEVGCGADNSSPDVAYKFTLAQPTRVRVQTEGSSFDTVIALVGDTCASSAPTPPAPAPELGNSTAVSGFAHTFLPGSIVIPMDTTYQNNGMLAAYGLVYTLLKNDVPVSWVIKKNKLSGEADFTASATVFGTSTTIVGYGYRGGPFVIDSTDASRASPFITTYLAAHPTVAVHSTTTSFDGYVRRQMAAAPRWALMKDGGEAAARAYLAAAFITDAAGGAWLDTSADVMTPTQLAGASIGVVNGSLFDTNLTPKYCGLISTGYPALTAALPQGVEVVSEVRAFLENRTSFFALNQSVLSFENSSAGHFLTQAGYTGSSATSAFFELNLDSPYAQLYGPLASGGGSIGSLTLPQLDQYKDNDAVIFGGQGGSSGENDLWVTGRLDGDCSILNETCNSGDALGKVSYLAGSTYTTAVPITSNATTNGTRLFLNSLFAADCILDEIRPAPTVAILGTGATTAQDVTYTINYINDGLGVAHSAFLDYAVPSGATYQSSTGGGSLSGSTVTWSLGALAANESGSVTVTVRFGAYGSFANQAVLRYGQGNTSRSVLSWVVTTAYQATLGVGCTALGVNNATVPNTNETQGTAYNANELKGRIHVLTGSTTGMAGNYTNAETGSCGTVTAAPDAAYHFHLDQAANVTINTDGTSWDTILALYNGTVSPSDTVTANNTADTTALPQALGSVNGKRISVSGGNSNSAGLVANYLDTEISCGADTASKDVVYSFTVTTPTNVKISTAGSGIDSVVSLHDGLIVQPAAATTTAISNTNEKISNAYNIATTPTLHDQTFTGSTTSLVANYGLPSSCYVGSSWSIDAKDAVYKFHIDSTSTYDINTNGSSFDTVMAVYPSLPTFTTAPVIDMGEGDATFAARYDVGDVRNSIVRVFGDTDDNANSWTASSGCNASTSARDGFVAFQISGTGNRTITFDTAGADFDTVIHVYRFTNVAQTTYTLEECDDDDGTDDDSYISRTLAPGNYFVEITGDGNGDDGDYELKIQDSSPTNNMIACDDDAGTGNASRLPSQSLSAGDYYAIVKGYYGNSSGYGNYTFQVKDNALAGSGNAHRLACAGSAQSNQITTSTPLAVGTYYVVVKGNASTDNGSYALTVEDVTTPPVGSVLECDDLDGTAGAAQIRRSLGIGDYWVVLKGKTSTAYGSYTVKISDDDAAVGTILECNDDGGDALSSVIERDLAAGTYYVMIKGDNAAEAGTYKLAVRDITRKSLNLLSCDDDSAAANTSHLQQNLAAGTYYVAVKGDAATDKGAYTLTVQDFTASPLGALTCNDDGGSYQTSVISRSLNPGTYYVALKGYDESAKGRYQLTVGGAATTSGSYVPPTWAQTLAALNARGARVIPILSCQDDPQHGNNLLHTGDCDKVRAQAQTLASSTDTFGKNLQPLVFDINRNGDGLSRNVVDGVAALAKYLEMDVRVVVSFDPDANPGFLVSITAVDEVGDGCTGLIGSEHQNCAPGATPRFNIAFTNPLPGVAPHPTDPNGGYTFRAQLIGDDQFIVEEVPIYIIPESLEPEGPEEPPIYEEGAYWQDTASPGCAGFNQTPDWRDLSWDADVYTNNTVRFLACTASTQEALDSCVPKQIAEVTGAGTCSSDSDCAVGYCDTGISICQIARADECTTDMQCGVNSYCDEDAGRCTYLSQPVYIGSALGSDNFQRFLRMKIELEVVEPFDDPPVLHNWEMTYYCNNTL